MNNIFFVCLFFTANICRAQTDDNGNPVFISVGTGEEKIKDYILLSNYYTLAHNIDNKGSSVYISKTPSLDEIESAATKLSSDFFMVTKKKWMLNIVSIANTPFRHFVVINTETGKDKNYPCMVKGDITENRAKEIIAQKYDPKAKINGNKLYFNGKEFTIIPTAEIKNSVVALIDKEKLATADSSGVAYMPQDEIRETILSETKKGGKLDFFTEIIGHEYDGVQIKPRLFATRKHVALYKWGTACFDIGINNVEDALAIYKVYKGKALDEREVDYITMGFYKKLDNE